MDVIKDKKTFESILKSYGFEEDSEYRGVMIHPDEHGITTYFNEDDGTMTISWDMEYSVKRTATEERLIALLETYQK